MKRLLLSALAAAFLLPIPAEADRLGRRLDAIQSGRLYDPLLTPRFNPSFEFQPNAEARFLHDLRQGRVNIDEIPERQRQYFQMRIEQNR